MHKILLGRISHWGLLALIAAFLYGVGTTKLHVIHFNFFITLLFSVATCLVVLLRVTTAHDENITRERLHSEEDITR